MTDTLDRFRASGYTLANLDQDFVQWHRGRSFYLCWMVMVDEPDWNRAMQQAAVRLQPWLVTDYRRQVHVTILPGGFPAPESVHLDAVREGARTVAPFRIRLGSLSSFTGSPCYEVLDDDDGLRRLRRMLRPVLCDPHSQVSDWDYQPHLTVGLYQGCFDTREMASVIERCPAQPAASMWVKSISLCAYETRSIKGAAIGGDSGRVGLWRDHGRGSCRLASERGG